MISTAATSPEIARALLVTVKTPEQDDRLIDDLMNELGELTRTLGPQIVDNLLVKISKPQPRYFIGSGNASGLARICKEKKASLLIFNNSLSPSQQRNLEHLIQIRVIDRHELILDIFAARASTNEAVLQIELARTEYLLPRLKRAWTHLSRQQGGVGIRGGEGEKQIEVDERLVRKRIVKLKQELKSIRKQRAEQRKKRQRKPIPNGAIVGYTNAGKSSLLNYLTDADLLVEDKLFATLDPTTRRIRLNNNQILLLTDTVGFVRHLPHDLVEAFKATLEEAVMADFLIHVVDATSPFLDHHIRTTHDVLDQIGAANKYTLIVFNKIDLVNGTYVLQRLRRRYPDALFTSVKTGQGLEKLSTVMADILNDSLKKMQLKIPAENYELVARLYRTSNVTAQRYENGSVYITASVPNDIEKEMEEFVILDTNVPAETKASRR